MAGIRIYETEKVQNDLALKYFFVSNGNFHIVKAIEYRFIQNFNGRALYNLGFGDYDTSQDCLLDRISSNNGDTYPVFYTVLNSVPNFFETFPEAMLMVQGSDSTPEFETDCRKKCKRRCLTICKKRHQRIRTYCKYVNRNYDDLNKIYNFWGGIKTGNQTVMENYQVGKDYTAVFLQRR